MLALLAIGGGALAHAQAPEPATTSRSAIVPADSGPIAWRRSYPVGSPSHGFLLRGVKLPPQGEDFFTWDPILDRYPNRGWRRWAADRPLRTVLRVIAEYRDAHPGAARVGIEDISRPFGGPFGSRYGGLGHASHQIGVDFDIAYPRRDGREEGIDAVEQVDRGLSRDLVRRFVRAGSVYVFVGPNTGLAPGGRQFGRPVQRLAYHDDHMHVRLRAGG